MLIDQRLRVNDSACFFDQELGRANGFWSVVFNPVEERYIRINPSGYKILKIIEESPLITFSELLWRSKIKESALKRFLEKMIDERVVFAL